jgi:hypothetical protein
MKVKKINLSHCDYCNQIAVMKIDKSYYCQYHGDKEIISRTIYKNENLPGISSSFPDYNRGDISDYKRTKKNKLLKKVKLVNEEYEIISITTDLLSNFNKCIISISKVNNCFDLLSITYDNISYIFSWKKELDITKVKQYLFEDTIQLAYKMIGGKIVKWY